MNSVPMRLLIAYLLLALSAPLAAQDPEDLPFTLDLVEVEVTGMPGLHSFAWAEHDGKWLFVAGRVDGLHGIVESGAFPDDKANDAVWVVDLAADQVWSRSLDELDDAVADPLRTTNPQHYQEGETLYIVGGYGTDSDTGDKITFPTLTAIDVPGMIQAVTTGGALAPHLRQIEDERLAVTGGELHLFDSYPPDFDYGYFLIGGQRFDGEYTLSGKSFTQEYTDAIRFFDIADDGASLALENYSSYENADLFHRRDMIVAPIYFTYSPADSWGLALYGGVFQPDANLPYLHPIFLIQGDDGLILDKNTELEQRFAHYTAPALPVQDSETSTTHTTFFGGMSQFYMDASGEIAEDILVPFVDHISTYSHSDQGLNTETVMPIRMPGLLGTNAVLIPASDAPRYGNGVVRLRALQGRTLMGWIVGGIESTMPNPGWMGMTTAETSASDRVFAVYLTPTFDTALAPEAGLAEIDFEGPYPNPFRAEATVAFTLDRPADLAVEVFDVLGRRMAVLHEGPLGAQRHTFSLRGDALQSGVYTIRVHGDGVHATQSMIRLR